MQDLISNKIRGSLLQECCLHNITLHFAHRINFRNYSYTLTTWTIKSKHHKIEDSICIYIFLNNIIFTFAVIKIYTKLWHIVSGLSRRVTFVRLTEERVRVYRFTAGICMSDCATQTNATPVVTVWY